MPKPTLETKGSPDPGHTIEGKLRQEVREKELLLSLNHDIVSTKNKKDLLRIIHPKLKELFSTSDIFICRFDKESECITPFLRTAGKERQDNADYAGVLNGHFSIHDQFINKIMQAKEPLVLDIEEVCAWPESPGYINISRQAGIEESLSAALYDGEELIGVLTIWADKKKAFTAHHRQLIRTVAQQISLIVTSISDNEKIRQREKENNVLLAVSHAIASIRDKNDLIRVIQKTLQSALCYSDIAITRFNLEKGTFKVFLEHCEKTNQHPDFEAIAFNEYPIADGIHDVIATADKTVVLSIPKLVKDGMVHIQFLEQAGIKELAGIKLRHNGKIIGTMVLLSAKDNSFPPDDQHIINEVSHHFATAMVNIIYNEEILQRNKETGILLSTSNAFASIRNKKELLPVLKSQLEYIPFYNDVSITNVDESGTTFSSFLFDSTSDRRQHPGSPKMEAAHHSFPDGIFEKALYSRVPVFFDLVALAGKPDSPSYINFIYENGIVDMAAVSLHDRNKEIGVLFLFSKQKRTFTDSQLSLVQAIGKQLGTAMANILANEKIEKQLEEISHYKEQLEEEKQYLQEEVSGSYSFDDIVGNGPAMQKIFQQLSRVASANSTVLILGETGTGKELIARAIHNSSTRRNNLMVKINCAALPASLIESELFGHEKGSFTGATDRRIGKFELANNGTFFLDEIGELPSELQVKILRAIQEKEIERIGGKGPIKVNVRIIAATNRDLQKEVEEGRFRQDLFYRLNVFPITLPALRHRKEDIPLLVQHFIEKFSKNAGKNIQHISGKVMKELLAYSWPGNVRELEHLIERSVLMTNTTTIKEMHLPMAKKASIKNNTDDDGLKTHEENERDHIIRALNKCNGKIFGPGGAAALLDLRVSTLNSKIKKLGIKKSRLYN